MAGLPKKYAKMGFKKGWREYRKVHPKGGKKKTTSKASPKKKTTKKKSYGGKKKMANAKSYAKNKMTPSNVAKMWAIGGAGIDRVGRYQETGDTEQLTTGTMADYSGWDGWQNKFSGEHLVRGYGGMANDIGWRKVAKAAGIKAYPTGKPKNMSQYIDYLTMYGKTVADGIANKDNPGEAHRAMYKTQYGVDLSQKGWGAYQPAQMLGSKGAYLAKKMIFKLARQAGYNI